MKQKTKIMKNKPLRRWMILQSVIIVIISVMTFLLVEFFVNGIIKHNWKYDPIDALGMIGPMSLFMWLVSYNFIKISSKYINQLMNGITTVADGDFSVRLDESDAGAMSELFRNFNKMASELEGVQTLRDDFINHFSHEFKTPITSINGFSTILRDEELPEEEAWKYLDIITSESKRLASLSDNALLITKLESQHIILNQTYFQLDEQVRESVILLMPQINKKEIELSVDLSPVKYSGNPELMKHIWINLLDNAVKYSSPGGNISISLSSKNGEIVFSITDKGIGMDEEAKTRIFEKYFQDKANSRQPGLGLGLSIVHRILILCQGRIEVESSQGKGSSFTVFLMNN